VSGVQINRLKQREFIALLGTLFYEGNYMNPLSHNLQVTDYNIFIFLHDAGLTQGDFSSPCGWLRTPRRALPAAWPFHASGLLECSRLSDAHLL
jgi:hypothetical protein